MTREQAEATIRALAAGLAAWQETDRLRASLPRSYAARIPPSRRSMTTRLLAALQRAGVIRLRSPSLGEPVTLAIAGGVVVVLVASAAALAALAHYAPQIMAEHRRAIQARDLARRAAAAYALERSQAEQSGPAQARTWASQRAAELSIPDDPQPPAPSPSSSGDGGPLDRAAAWLTAWWPGWRTQGLLALAGAAAVVAYSRSQSGRRGTRR